MGTAQDKPLQLATDGAAGHAAGQRRLLGLTLSATGVQGCGAADAAAKLHTCSLLVVAWPARSQADRAAHLQPQTAQPSQRPLPVLSPQSRLLVGLLPQAAPAKLPASSQLTLRQQLLLLLLLGKLLLVQLLVQLGGHQVELVLPAKGLPKPADLPRLLLNPQVGVGAQHGLAGLLLHVRLLLLRLLLRLHRADVGQDVGRLLGRGHAAAQCLAAQPQATAQLGLLPQLLRPAVQGML